MPSSVHTAADGTPLLLQQPYPEDPDETPPLLLAFDERGMARPFPAAPEPAPGDGLLAPAGVDAAAAGLRPDTAPVGDDLLLAPASLPPAAPPLPSVGSLAPPAPAESQLPSVGSLAPAAPGSPAQPLGGPTGSLPDLPGLGFGADTTLTPPAAPPGVSVDAPGSEGQFQAAAVSHSGINLPAAQGIAGEVDRRRAQIADPAAARADAGYRAEAGAAETEADYEQQRAAAEAEGAQREAAIADAGVRSARELMKQRDEVHKRNTAVYMERLESFEKRAAELQAQKPWILGKDIGATIARGLIGALGGGLEVMNPHLAGSTDRWLNGLLEREARRQSAITEVKQMTAEAFKGLQIRDDAFQREGIRLQETFVQANLLKQAEAQTRAQIATLAPGKIRAQLEQALATIQQKRADKLNDIDRLARAQATDEVRLTHENKRFYAAQAQRKAEFKQEIAFRAAELGLQQAEAQRKAAADQDANLVRDTIGRPLAVFGPGRSPDVKDKVHTQLADATDLAEGLRDYRALLKLQGQPFFSGSNALTRLMQSQISAQMHATAERLATKYRKAVAGLTQTPQEAANALKFLPNLGSLSGGDAEVFMNSVEVLINQATGEMTTRGGFDPESSARVRQHLQSLSALPEATDQGLRSALRQSLETGDPGRVARGLHTAALMNPTVLATPEAQQALAGLRELKKSGALPPTEARTLKMIEELERPDEHADAARRELTPQEATGRIPAVLDLGLGGGR